MAEEKLSQEFSLKNIDDTGNYFIEERNQIELISRKQQKACKALNYSEKLLF